MKIALYGNYLHHHQAWLAEELYRLTDGEYRCVCMQELPDGFKKSGYPNCYDKPFVIKAYEHDGFLEAEKWALDADAVLFHGNEDIQHFRDLRLKADKLSFESGERWLKKGLLNLLSPRLLRDQFRYHTRYYKCRNYYALNASAFGASDYSKLQSFKGRCFKWGYFTKVVEFEVQQKKYVGNRLMWVNRFIDWKHPELPILLAKKLKDNGYEFSLDMFGSGELLDKMKLLSKKMGVENLVRFRGNLPNDEVLCEMREHDIVLTTSDENEGWGAVVNEAMSNGCVLIGSDKVGSVPFLVKDGVNGLIFKSKDLNSLYEKVVSVLDKPDLCATMAEKAYYTMRDVWSPENAAKSLLTLCESLINNNDIAIFEGPCSRE